MMMPLLDVEQQSLLLSSAVAYVEGKCTLVFKLRDCYTFCLYIIAALLGTCSVPSCCCLKAV